MLDLNHLAHFLAVARHRHFHHAAKSVHLSQSALTRSIQALEAAVGRQLLIRSRGGVELTAHGSVVAEHAEVLLRERQRLLDELERVHEAAHAPIRIGLGAFPAELSGVEAAAKLIGHTGRLLCHARIGDFRGIARDVLARRIDLGFCDLAAAREDRRLRCTPTRAHQLFAYTRPDHPLHASPPPSTAALFRYPLIAVRAPLRMNVDRSSSIHDFDEVTGELLPALNAATPELVLKHLDHCDAVAFATLSMIEHLLTAGRVALVRIRDPQLTLQPGFIHLADRAPGATALRYIEEVTAIEERVAQRNRELEARYGVAGA